MDNINILPADTYVVVNKTILKGSDRKILTMLYQPIIGINATNLYLTLWNDLDKNEFMSLENNHHHLMTSMKISLNDIVVAREKLEAIGLLRTFYKKEHDSSTYIYELFSCLEANEFLSHPILNIVLYNNVGKKEYERIVSYFKVPRVKTSDYIDITKSFSDVFESVPGGMFLNEQKDIKSENKLSINISSDFDFDMLEASFNNETINKRAFTKDIKDLIRKLSYIYNLDVEPMKHIIVNSLNDKLMIDKTVLRKSARNYYQFENSGKLPTLIYQKQPEYLKNPIGNESKRAKMIYVFESISPYNFLKSKYNGAKPTTRDLNLIENLMVDVGLRPAVINVLIDYVMKINNKKLSKNFVETIAGQWKRLNIETAEDAMNQAEKEYKKGKKKVQEKSYSKKKEIELPEWFDKTIDKKEITKEEENNLKDMLKEFV